ncbi:MAG: acyl-CoA synthetase [Pseudomonadota bacterium]
MPRPAMIETIKDIEKMEQTPWRAHCPDVSTYDAIKRSARLHGDLPALQFLPTGSAGETPHIVSYSHLLKRITQTANLFHSLGIGPKDVVSYVLPNFPETHDVIWGAETAGIVNAINPFLEPRTIRKLLSAAQTKVIVTTPPLPGLNLWDPVVSVADALDHVTTVLFIDPAQYFGMPPTQLPSKTLKGKPIFRFQDARDAEPDSELVFDREIDAKSIASLFHTGGTTGVPKLAPHTHENEVFNAWAISRITPFEPGEVILTGLPLFHVNAVIVSGLSAFFAGASQLMAGPFGFRGPGVIQNTWKLIAHHKVVSMSGVPTIYAALMSVPKDGLDISSLRFSAVGAAPISPDLFRNFVDHSGVELLEGYGLTESTVVASMNPLGGEKRVGSIGFRLPYLEMHAAQLDASGEVQRFCETDEVGTIIIRGPSVFPGYYLREDTGLTSDGWLNTGDLGRRDKDGYFWLTGRAKDVIIRGGHNIDPGMIENTLEAHKAVAVAAAIGQPDEYAGELPAAYVELQPGAEISSADLIAWAKSNIPERAAAPVYLEVMDQLPVTAVGKIHKPTLRRMAIARVISSKIRDVDAAARVLVESDEKQGIITRVISHRQIELRQLLGGFALNLEFTAE